MHPELKKYLIRLFLIIKFPDSFKESWLTNMADYQNIDEAIESINNLKPRILDLDNSHELKHLGIFFSLLNKAVHFPYPDRPHDLEHNKQFNNYLIQQQSVFDKVENLPDCNYTLRKTEQLIAENDIKYMELKARAIQKLMNIAEREIPDIKLTTLENAIKNHEIAIANQIDINNKIRLENELILLKDLNKLFKLSIINIPMENGNPDSFCILDDAAGGVTEKLSLVGLDEVKKQLQNIQENEIRNLTDYCFKRENFKLSTQAILKLPKHASIIEVQRESIALNISRILGFNTAKSTMIEHEGKAALFVPFDKIQVLKEVAMGEEKIAILPSSFSFAGLKKIGEKYLHYSTIVPVGNQLHSDQIINDFGHVMAFSYLCNDTDFIGMENQNKAIKDCDLYIFDQVIMSKAKMELDSRLNLVPIGVGKHSRHNQGRNRSLIEDSSFDTKFTSIIDLLKSKNDINFMLDEIYFSHSSKIAEIETAISYTKVATKIKHMQNQLANLKVLQDDVLSLKKTVNDRLKNIFQNFPTINGNTINSQLFLTYQNLIKHSLMFEKLVNKPVLFANDGRPYKHPWTYRNINKISAIEERNGNVYLSFKDLQTSDLIATLKQLKIKLNTCKWDDKNKILIIPFVDLLKIHENKIFPEHLPFNSEENYLNNFKRVSAAYPENNQKLYENAIDDYQHDLYSAKNTEDKLKAIDKILYNIYFNLGHANNPGLEKHLELNVQMDIQQQLRQLIPELSAEIGEAFKAAVSLDRVKDFNYALLSYAYNPQQNQDLFQAYLSKCIGHAEKAGDYNQAKIESQAMQNESFTLYNKLTAKSETSMAAISKLGGKSSPSKNEDWDEEDVLISQKSRKYAVQSQLEKVTNAITEKEEPTKSNDLTNNPTIKVV
ncbi:MAG: hypothetical protein H0T84_01940 [Tatlockia sp.]|nr:hypothetical protein [Tatlockia sp.]